MKRIGAFSLAFFIFTLSIFAFIPIGVYANDAYVISKNSDEVTALSSSEAQAAIDANSDIKGKDGVTMLLYTPTDTYNYTLKSGAFVCHMSDAQAKAMLMSSKSYQQYVVLVSSLLSNNSVIRGFVSSVGALTTKDSKTLTNILDDVTCNYNYLDSLNYDEDSQTITMSNDNGSVDKLREEIRKYYYKDNGMFYIGGSLNKPTDIIKSSWYDDMTLYQEDYNAVSNYDFAIGSNQSAFYFNSSDYSYIYLYLKTDSYFGSGEPYNNASVWWQFTDNDLNPVTLPNYTKSLNCTEYTSTKEYNMIYNEYAFRFYTWYSSNVRGNYSERLLNNIRERVCIDTASTSYGINPFVQWKTENLTDNSYYDYISSSFFYAKPNKTFFGFTSYDALFDYVHGKSSAYLGSAINKVGEDITFSIKDMNENIGSKMDTLIDSINDKKGSMSADELQNAIDKGLEDLNKNTEDIKDNTSSILDKLEEQNQILLQILGVTEFIAYQEVKENSDQYNMSYLKTLLDSMFTGLFNALMYGENTVDDNNTDTASIQSFSVSNAAAPVAVYSDDIAVYDSSGSGGGSDSSGGHFFDLKNGLFGKFPFSIPYQCYNWLQILQRDPEAPTFTLDYGYLFGCSGDPKFVLSFDLSRYNDIAEVGRSFCRLFMTLMLALGIYHKNKGEM